ncbi:hypothetical protein [Natronorubrum bangense]|nr:hypothetical protein [Natronorubrum bangense]
MVDTLVLESGDVFNQHLTEVCARNYFYGNPVVEGELANLEGYHSQYLTRHLQLSRSEV